MNHRAAASTFTFTSIRASSSSPLLATQPLRKALAARSASYDYMLLLAP